MTGLEEGSASGKEVPDFTGSERLCLVFKRKSLKLFQSKVEKMVWQVDCCVPDWQIIQCSVKTTAVDVDYNICKQLVYQHISTFSRTATAVY